MSHVLTLIPAHPRPFGSRLSVLPAEEVEVEVVGERVLFCLSGQ